MDIKHPIVSFVEGTMEQIPNFYPIPPTLVERQAWPAGWWKTLAKNSQANPQERGIIVDVKEE